MIPSGQPLGGPASPTSPHRGPLFQLKLVFIPIFQYPCQTVHSPEKVQLPRHFQDAAASFPKDQKASQHPPMFLAWPQRVVGERNSGAPLPPPGRCSEARPLWGPCARPLNSMFPGLDIGVRNGSLGVAATPTEGLVAVQLAQQPRKGGKKDGSPRWIWKDDQL